MDHTEEIVIVGAGLAGLAVAVGLHRKGLRSLVLESSDTLRAAGFALTVWTNAWRALDALGVGDSLRRHHLRLQAVVMSSASSASLVTKLPAKEHEVRCVRRNLLVEALAGELPHGTIRYSSKVVAMEDSGESKLLHLADGSTLKAKVVVGCDGINSAVSKWLGLKPPTFSGRHAARGFTVLPDGHGMKPEFMQYNGEGFRAGVLPCDEKSLYWFFTWTSNGEKETIPDHHDALMVKEFVLGKVKASEIPEQVVEIIDKSELSSVASAPLRYRSPLNLLSGNICKGNTCVTGDAFHPMTPDLGQGGCSALEDGVVLARCLADALCGGGNGEEEHRNRNRNRRVEAGLKDYEKARKWRAFRLVVGSYALGFVQESGNWFLRLVRERILAGFLVERLFVAASFDCGKL
ncbi:monooxygenase 2-like [Curcuma longa]|uniref:monooxygenase 2-like n=1 Tax=Curcuma longa TaxID=136217 RepID=UPI003D9ED81B